MPPRHAYWTILVDDQPTAFRAHEAEELLPTLNRLREKNASAVLKWFERGQLFDSRDAARDAGFGRGERRWEGPRPDRQSEDERGDHRRGEQRTRGAQTAPRDKNWRPGGDHRDPRQKYRDAKKAKWNRFKQKIRDAHDRRERRGSDVRPESFSPPHGDPLREEISHRPRQEWREDRRGAPSRPHGDKMRSRPPREEWRRDDRDRTRSEREQRSRSSWPDREHSQPQDRGRTPGERKPFTPKRGPRKPWGSKPGAPARKPWGGKPPGAAGRKPWSGKPAGSGRKPWGSKPAGRGRKPWGSKPQARPAHKPWDTKRKRRQDDDE